MADRYKYENGKRVKMTREEREAKAAEEAAWEAKADEREQERARFKAFLAAVHDFENLSPGQQRTTIGRALKRLFPRPEEV